MKKNNKNNFMKRTSSQVASILRANGITLNPETWEMGERLRSLNPCYSGCSILTELWGDDIMDADISLNPCYSGCSI